MAEPLDAVQNIIGAFGPDETSKVEIAPVQAPGLIEIVLSDGVVVRVDARVDADALRRVLAALGTR